MIRSADKCAFHLHSQPNCDDPSMQDLDASALLARQERIDVSPDLLRDVMHATPRLLSAVQVSLCWH